MSQKCFFFTVHCNNMYQQTYSSMCDLLKLSEEFVNIETGKQNHFLCLEVDTYIQR